jgi:hypothetical protein
MIDDHGEDIDANEGERQRWATPGIGHSNSTPTATPLVS